MQHVAAMGLLPQTLNFCNVVIDTSPFHSLSIVTDQKERNTKGVTSVCFVQTLQLCWFIFADRLLQPPPAHILFLAVRMEWKQSEYQRLEILKVTGGLKPNIWRHSLLWPI
ncbi:hypothetical protein QL285_008744 [Trifolium repens]|nr:hypothetical protein QL285_008744 [Trifolium repens]